MPMNKSKLNAQWHTQNKMPHNPSLDQRIAWHLEIINGFKSYLD